MSSKDNVLMFFYLFSELISSSLVIVIAGGAILFAVAFGVGTVEVHNAVLKCFHCGRETSVGRKTCEWCGEELQ